MSSAIRIRLARHGMRNAPVYHIVAIQAGKAREARPLEKLGEYDPIPRVRNTEQIPVVNRVFGKEYREPPKEKTVTWDVGRIKFWLARGAEPSTSVVKLLAKGGILETPKYTPKMVDELKERFQGQTSPTTLVRLAERKKERDDYRASVINAALDRDSARRGFKAEVKPESEAGASVETKAAEGSEKREVKARKPRKARSAAAAQ